MTSLSHEIHIKNCLPMTSLNHKIHGEKSVFKWWGLVEKLYLKDKFEIMIVKNSTQASSKVALE